MAVSVYTPVPDKTLFLDLKTGKTYIGPKTNSKQLLWRCFYVFRNHTKLWFAGKRKKMSIAPLAQKLLRIVFCTYICFPGFQIQKKCFVGDRCVSLGDLRFQDCARIGWGLWIAIPVLVCVGQKWVWGMHPDFARIVVEWTVMTCSSTGAIARILLGVFREWVLTQYFWGYGYCSFVGWGGRGSFWSISARFSLHCLLRPTPGLFYIFRQVSYFNCGRILWLWEDCSDCGTLYGIIPLPSYVDPWAMWCTTLEWSGSSKGT